MRTIDGQSYLSCQEVAERMTGTVVKQWTADDVKKWAATLDASKTRMVGAYCDPQSGEYFFRQDAIEFMVYQLSSSPSL